MAGVDTHAHVFTKSLALAADRRYTPGYDAPVADYIAMLDGNGVSHGVLVQPSFLGTDNRYLVQALRLAPDRLRGIAVVGLDTSRDDLLALREDGIVGVRLNLLGRATPEFGAPAWRRHIANVAALGWQVEVQAQAHRLPAILTALLPAGVAVVVDHFGRPDPVRGVDDPGFRGLLEFADTGRVWVKLSAAYRNAPYPGGETSAAKVAALLLRAFGPERLVWGSDWPHTRFEAFAGPATTPHALADWLTDPADRRIVLAETPARLFRFEPPSSPEQSGSAGAKAQGKTTTTSTDDRNRA